MNQVLILFCHPSLENSRINRAWVDRVEGLEGITLHDLYEEYPTFDVDVAKEQELLANNDVIVLQHPFYWYSAPALMKQWFELTLEHGWAYGTGGDALKGKLLLNAITTGGKHEAYTTEGFHETTLSEFLSPVRQTARLCKMHYLPPFVAHGAFTMSELDVAHSADDYALLLTSLRDHSVELDEAGTQSIFDPHNRRLFRRETD